MTRPASLVRTMLCCGLVAASMASMAQEQSAAHRDPWVPPQVAERARAAKAPMSAASADLRAQVESKLRASFDAADVEKKGSITREQAVNAQLGIVANNFDAIDTVRNGRITFEDFKRFLRARGARTF